MDRYCVRGHSVQPGCAKPLPSLSHPDMFLSTLISVSPALQPAEFSLLEADPQWEHQPVTHRVSWGSCDHFSARGFPEPHRTPHRWMTVVSVPSWSYLLSRAVRYARLGDRIFISHGYASASPQTKKALRQNEVIGQRTSTQMLTLSFSPQPPSISLYECSAFPVKL